MLRKSETSAEEYARRRAYMLEYYSRPEVKARYAAHARRRYCKAHPNARKNITGGTPEERRDRRRAAQRKYQALPANKVKARRYKRERRARLLKENPALVRAKEREAARRRRLMNPEQVRAKERERDRRRRQQDPEKYRARERAKYARRKARGIVRPSHDRNTPAGRARYERGLARLKAWTAANPDRVLEKAARRAIASRRAKKPKLTAQEKFARRHAANMRTRIANLSPEARAMRRQKQRAWYVAKRQALGVPLRVKLSPEERHKRKMASRRMYKQRLRRSGSNTALRNQAKVNLMKTLRRRGYTGALNELPRNTVAAYVATYLVKKAVQRQGEGI